MHSPLRGVESSIVAEFVRTRLNGLRTSILVRQKSRDFGDANPRESPPATFRGTHPNRSLSEPDLDFPNQESVVRFRRRRRRRYGALTSFLARFRISLVLICVIRDICGRSLFDGAARVTASDSSRAATVREWNASTGTRISRVTTTHQSFVAVN